MKVAFIKDGAVESVQTVVCQVPDSTSPVVIPDGVSVDLHDLCAYTPPVFTDNPLAAEILAVANKKKEIAMSLADVTTNDELKTVVAQINSDVNP